MKKSRRDDIWDHQKQMERKAAKLIRDMKKYANSEEVKAREALIDSVYLALDVDRTNPNETHWEEFVQQNAAGQVAVSYKATRGGITWSAGPK